MGYARIPPIIGGITPQLILLYRMQQGHQPSLSNFDLRTKPARTLAGDDPVSPCVVFRRAARFMAAWIGVCALIWLTFTLEVRPVFSLGQPNSRSIITIN